MVRFLVPPVVVVVVGMLWLTLLMDRITLTSARQQHRCRQRRQANENQPKFKGVVRVSTGSAATPSMLPKPQRLPRSLQDKVVETTLPPKVVVTPAPQKVVVVVTPAPSIGGDDPAISSEPSLSPIPQATIVPPSIARSPAPTRAPNAANSSSPTSWKFNVTLAFVLIQPPQSKMELPNNHNNITSSQAIESNVLLALEGFLCDNPLVSWDRGGTESNLTCANDRKPIQIPVQSSPQIKWQLTWPQNQTLSVWEVSLPARVSDQDYQNVGGANNQTNGIEMLRGKIQESLNSAIRDGTFDQWLAVSGLVQWKASAVGNTTTTTTTTTAAPIEAATTAPNNNTDNTDNSSVPSYRRGVDELRLVGVFLLVLTLDVYVVLLWLANRRRQRKIREAEARDPGAAPLVVKTKKQQSNDDHDNDSRGDDSVTMDAMVGAASSDDDHPTLATMTQSTSSESRTSPDWTFHAVHEPPALLTDNSRSPPTLVPALPSSSLTIVGVHDEQSRAVSSSPSLHDPAMTMEVPNQDPDPVQSDDQRPSFLWFT